MKRSFILFAVLATACAAPSSTGGPRVEIPSAAAEANKEVVRRFYEVINQGDWNAIDALVGPGFIHRTPDTGQDLAHFKQGAANIRSGVPDYNVSVEEMVAEGNKVAVRLTGRGTHRGSFYGEAPTGRSIVAHGMMIHRLEGSRIVEIWELSDMHPTLEELGAVPRAAHAGVQGRAGHPKATTNPLDWVVDALPAHRPANR